MTDDIDRLAGKPGRTEYMMIANTLIEKWQFEEWQEQGYFSKRIAKAGWKPTHIETWIWKKDRSTIYPYEVCLRKSEVKLELIS